MRSMRYHTRKVFQAIVAVLCIWIPLVHAANKISNDDFKLVCYYTNWSIYKKGHAKFTPENIDPHLCTHLIYAFAGMNNNYELMPLELDNDIKLGNYEKFTNLKTYNPKLKVLIAVGGWNEGSKRFTKLVESRESRLRFIHGAMSFLRKYKFDGLNIDWEYPGFRDGAQDTDKEGYAKLVKELREAFDEEDVSSGNSKLLVTMTVPSRQMFIDRGFNIPALSKSLDFFIMLTYDYHTALEPLTNHHAPLKEMPDLEEWDPNKLLNVEWSVKYYIKKGADPKKLVVGIPTYGRSYTLLDPAQTAIGSPAEGPGDKGNASTENGYLPYYEICRLIQEDDWELESPYPDRMGPHAYKDNQWVGFDDKLIVIEKVKFIVKEGLGGGMVWSLDNDDFRGKCYGEKSPLINTLKISLKEGSSLLTQTISTTTDTPNVKKVSTTTTTLPRKTTTTTTTTTPKPSLKDDIPNDLDGLKINLNSVNISRQNMEHLLQLLQQLGVNPIRDKIQSKDSIEATSTVNPALPQYTSPNRYRQQSPVQTTQTTDMFNKFAKSIRNGKNYDEESSVAQETRSTVRPRGPQFDSPSSEANGANHDDFEDVVSPTSPSDEDTRDRIDFPFVYHTPSRRRSQLTPEAEEVVDAYDEPTTTTSTAKPMRAGRRVIVKLRPINGEHKRRNPPRTLLISTIAGENKRQNRRNDYVLAQTISVQQVARPNSLEESTAKELVELLTSRPSIRRARPVTRAPPRKMLIERYRGLPQHRELMVRPTGSPAVPATTRGYNAYLPEPREPALTLLPDGRITCIRRGVYPHPNDCAKFIACVPARQSNEEYDVYIRDCPKNTYYTERNRRCTPKKGSSCNKGKGEK